MDKRAAEALEKSIKHWQENVAAETPGQVKTSGEYCALCREFALKNPSRLCTGCPVNDETDAGCDMTPYHNANMALARWHKHGFDNHREMWRVAAQKELDFLISLRKPVDGAAP